MSSWIIVLPRLSLFFKNYFQKTGVECRREGYTLPSFNLTGCRIWEETLGVKHIPGVQFKDGINGLSVLLNLILKEKKKNFFNLSETGKKIEITTSFVNLTLNRFAISTSFSLDFILGQCINITASLTCPWKGKSILLWDHLATSSLLLTSTNSWHINLVGLQTPRELSF